MENRHIVAVAYPAQGHVIPLMELGLKLVKHGIKVTFVNTDFNHKRVMKAVSEDQADDVGKLMRLVSIPDGLEPWDDRTELQKLTESTIRVMPGNLEALIRDIDSSEEDRVTCVIADENNGWALEVAEKLKLPKVAFWPASAATLALGFCIPKLVEDGIVDLDGNTLKNEVIKLSPNMPAMHPRNFFWSCFEDPGLRKFAFDLVQKNCNLVETSNADWLLCNTAEELESGTFELHPNIIPIGPLLATTRLGKSAGYFWEDDSTSLQWLHHQPNNSVIYVAFGSFTIFSRTQFQELALGLELCNRPFLWVVRQDITPNADDAFPEGFKDRVKNRGKLVSWSPQQNVLSHPSIACFISHCGWNSTIEGVSNGVPFLCWPYFADQFLDESYICDDWKIGLGFERDENGIILRGEIKSKVEQLLGDEGFKERAVTLQSKALQSIRDEDGSSCRNFDNFVRWIKKI